MGLITLIAAGFLIKSSLDLSEQKNITDAALRQLNTIKRQGDDLYEIQKIKEYLSGKGGQVDQEKAAADKDLTTGYIIKLARKYELGTPGIRNLGETNKKDYRERKFKFDLKDKYLEDIINFMIEIEKVNNTQVENFNFVRDLKNKDKWNANNITVTQILAKS